MSSLYSFSEVWGDKAAQSCVPQLDWQVLCGVPAPPRVLQGAGADVGRPAGSGTDPTHHRVWAGAGPGGQLCPRGHGHNHRNCEGVQHWGRWGALLFPRVGCFGSTYTRTTAVAPLRWSSQCCKCIKCEFLQKLPNFYNEELFYGIICLMFFLYYLFQTLGELSHCCEGELC